MPNLDEILARVSKQQLDNFNGHIETLRTENKLTVSMFKYLYLFSLLGGGAPRKHWHDWVDSVSLCQPEIDYMHILIDLPETPVDDFAESAISEYNKVDDLPKCQLGDNMLKFLEVALNATFLPEEEEEK